MKKSLANTLLALATIFHTEEYDFPIIGDEKVLDCIMSMYFFLLLDEKDEKKEEYYQKFHTQYISLTPEQQEQVKEDYLSIIKAQDENVEKEFMKQPNKKPE